MGFLDAMFGRRKPTRPNLDALFAVPSAALTLEVAMGFRPTGVGSVCYRATEGAAFADVPNAEAALASVPVASTYFRLAGVAPTVNPWPFSHDATALTSDWAGENWLRNCAGVRNLP